MLEKQPLRIDRQTNPIVGSLKKILRTGVALGLLVGLSTFAQESISKKGSPKQEQNNSKEEKKPSALFIEASTAYDELVKACETLKNSKTIEELNQNYLLAKTKYEQTLSKYSEAKKASEKIFTDTTISRVHKSSIRLLLETMDVQLRNINNWLVKVKNEIDKNKPKI